MRYQIERIPLPQGYEAAYPKSVNDSGHVVGSLRAIGRRRSQSSFIYAEGASRLVSSSALWAINSSGMIAGEVVNAKDSRLPATFDLQGRAYVLPLQRSGFVKAINDAGITAGMLSPPKETSYIGVTPFLWQGGELRTLEVPEGYFGGTVSAINELGIATGHLNVFALGTALSSRAVVWNDKQAELLPIPSGYSGSDAVGIDLEGRILCKAFYINPEHWSKLSQEGTAAIEQRRKLHSDILNGMEGLTFYQDAYIVSHGQIEMMSVTHESVTDSLMHGIARAMSASGSALVAEMKSDQQHRIYLYSGGTIEVVSDHIENACDWLLYDATAIASHGRIAGYGKYRGDSAAFMLTPY